MPKTMEIRGHGGHVGIEVYDYERPDTPVERDANWLTAKCTVGVGEFSCILALFLLTEEFVQFLAQLEEAVRLCAGTAVFTTSEEGLDVEIKFRSGGQADVFGKVRSRASLVPEQTVLSFSFETDQTFLAQTVHELKEIVEQFPIRKPSA